MGRKKPPPQKIHTNFTLAEVEDFELKKLFTDTVESFFSDNTVDEYIKALGANSRKIYTEELKTALAILHPLAMSNARKSLNAHGYIKTADQEFHTRTDQKELIRTITYATQTLPEEKFIKLYKKTAAIVEAQNLTNYILDPILQSNPGLHFIGFDFPAAFCTGLEDLIYRPWYTACFMSKCEDSSIWGTYGEEHRGICLRYQVEEDRKGTYMSIDVPVLEEDNDVLLKPNENLYFREVKYTSKHLEMNFFSSLFNMPESDRSDYWYTDEKGAVSDCQASFKNSNRNAQQEYDDNITTKMAEWANENEYRLILYPANCTLDVPTTRVLSYQAKYLEGIIFGIKTWLNDKMKALNIITKHYQSTNHLINVYQARYDSTTKKISYTQVDINLINFSKAKT